MYLIPQAVTFTPFNSPILAKFGFKSENDENKEIVLSSYFIEPKFFKKKLCHLHKLHIGR